MEKQPQTEDSMAISQPFGPTEAQIRLAVADLAAQHRDARSLTAAVCRLLFYNYDEAPNANRVYNLTRRGSLTTIHEAVGQFWQGLRAQTQAHIECPGLAADLAGEMGQFLAKMIASTETRLRAEMAQYRDDADNQVGLAQQAQLAAEQALATVQGDVVSLQDQLLQQAEKLKASQVELTRAQAQVEALQAELAASKLQIGAGQDQLAQLREQQARELTLYAEGLAAAESRATGAEQRALERIEESTTLLRQQTQRVLQLEKAIGLERSQAKGSADQVLALTAEAGVMRGRILAYEEAQERHLARIAQLEVVTSGQATRKPQRRAVRPIAR